MTMNKHVWLVESNDEKGDYQAINLFNTKEQVMDSIRTTFSKMLDEIKILETTKMIRVIIKRSGKSVVKAEEIEILDEPVHL